MGTVEQDASGSPASTAGALGSAGVVAVLVIVAAWVGRQLWFFSDDWNIFAEYHSGNLLEPFNGHLSLLPAGIYQFLFHTVGVGSYVPYRVVGLLALAVLGFQVARFAGKRVGAVATVLAVVAVLWNSAGTTNVMFPFLMNFSLPIAALLGIWWHLDALESSAARPDGSTAHRNRHLLAVSLWLVLALAASGLGVVAALAVAVELVLRRSPIRTWVAWAVPVALWAIWWLGHREANEISTDVGQVVPYFLRMLWAGPTSVSAGVPLIGLAVGGVLVAAVVVVSWRTRRLDPRVMGALGAAVAFGGLTSLTRQDTFPPIPPDELRYGWTIAAYLVLAAVALVPAAVGTRGSATGVQRSAAAVPERWRQPVKLGSAVVASVVLAAGAIVLVGDMGDWSDQVADAAPGLRTNLYAAEAAGAERMSPGAVIGPLSFVPVSAQDYLDAVASVGSPLQGAAADEIGGRQDQRDAAAELFFDNVALSAPTPAVGAVPEDLSGCAADLESAPGTVLEVVVRADGEAGPATISVGRFGAEALTFELDRSLSELVLPEDARVGTDVAEPYVLSTSGSAVICP